MNSFKSLVILTLLATSFSFFAQNKIDQGINFYKDKKFKEAKVIFENVSKNESKNGKAKYYLGLIAMVYERDMDKANDLFEEAVELDKNNADYHYMLGAVSGRLAATANIFKQVSLANKTKDEFEKAIELNPKHIDARAALLQYYLRAPGIMGGSVEKAKGQAQEISKLNQYKGWLSFATIAGSEQKFGEEENYYKKAITEKPDSSGAYIAYGNFCTKQKRFDDALKYFKKYSELEPKEARAFETLGDGYLSKEMKDEAIKSYQKALSLDSNFASSIFKLAKAYEAKGMKKEAKEHYSRYIKFVQDGKNAEFAKKKLEEL
ncbi:MAG: hypothetical protein CVV24_15375 [Ignavibacteriae bacterium HGW-Ignavibacteriae-3]|nr:MAG: hypothetical protein CVV24_15375 [Ignavibacteriae bacterium HGW-Ignavibacteriae-3]